MSKTSRGPGLSNSSPSNKTQTPTQLKLKSLYTQLVAHHTQKNRPFGNAEEKFRLQDRKKNGLFNGNDIKNFQISRTKRKQDNLEGGIGTFLNQTQRISKLEKRSTRELSNHSKINTHRVIQPDLDTGKQKIMHKRLCASAANSANGSLTSLFDKTPIANTVRGKKCFANRPSSGGKEWKPCVKVITPIVTRNTISRTIHSRGKKHF